MFELAPVKVFDLSEHISEIDNLLYVYQKQVEEVDKILDFFSKDMISSTFHHFYGEGEKPQIILDRKHAIASMNSSYWTRLMESTELTKIMPAERKAKWNEMIKNFTAPNFERDLVYGTIEQLTSMEAKFFAERIDGVFRKLSRDHVTNCPEGFSKRMIFTRICTDFDYAFFDWVMLNYITDLRMVIATIFGDTPEYNDLHGSTGVIFKEAVNNYGSWTFMDGGTLKIKIFKNGNAHFEIHPEVAFQLNKQLHLLHPTAIPSQFRMKPAKKSKEFNLIEKPLPSIVINMLVKGDHGLKKNPIHGYRSPEYIRDPKTFGIYNTNLENYDKRSKELFKEVMHSIGGVPGDKHGYMFEFERDPMDVIKMIITYGRVPDDKSFQFYPTPDEISEYVVSVASVREGDTVLEPSAGTGSLINGLRKDCKVTAIEIAAIRAKYLEKFELDSVVCADFMKWESDQKYNVILMNPPYNMGQCKAHIEKALTHVASGGKIIAVVPTTFHEKYAGCEVVDMKTFHNLFDNTNISVKVIKITNGN